jgi:small subunit ribosomal protein S6
MSLYELTYILRSDLEDDAVTAVQDRISGRVKDAEGELVKSEGWGRRRLAYPIERVREGYYFTSILKLPGDQVRTFENQLKLVPELMRFLLIGREEQNIDLKGSLLPASHRPAPAPSPATGDEASPATAEADEPTTSEAPAEAETTTEAGTTSAEEDAETQAAEATASSSAESAAEESSVAEPAPQPEKAGSEPDAAASGGEEQTQENESGAGTDKTGTVEAEG